MFLIIISLALVALVAWFFKACIHRGANEPPRAWLSSTPPLIEYGKDPVAFLRHARAKYGDVFTIPGPLPMTFVFEMSAVRAYFDSPETELSFLHGVMKIVGHLFGPDLLTAGALRDTLNGIIFKGLHQSSALNGYRPFLNGDTDAEIARLASLPSFSVFEQMSRVIVRLSVRMLFGSFVPLSLYARFSDLWPELEENAFHPLTLAATWLPFGPPARFHKLREEGFGEISKAIARAFETKKMDDDSYLGMIIREHYDDFPPSVRNRLKLHLCSIMFGAHTNSATAMGWLLARLTENPEAYNKAFEEQMAVAKEFGDSFNGDAVAKMVYLDACFKETTRQMASLVIFRYAMKPTPIGAFTLPAGSLVVVSPKGVHDDPAIYSSPDTWNPNNFLNALPRPSCNYISFGSGEHRCKGEKIASYEAKIVIGKIIRKYRVVRISPSNGVVEPDYAKPSAGLPHTKAPFVIRLEPRSTAAIQ